jgi:deazaflavin-dependent oxidoreductase (nitroreductase family)
MSKSTTRPPSRRAQAVIFRVVNVPMRVLLGLPVRTPLSRRLMLVHHIGRRTGKHYRQPVSYVEADSVLLSPGGGRWTRNLRDSEPVRIHLRGRDRSFRPELVRDPDEIERLLGVIAKANPALNRFVRIPHDGDGRLDQRALGAAIEHGFRIVRWHPHPAGRS